MKKETNSNNLPPKTGMLSVLTPTQEHALARQPFYIQVAHWCMMQEEWVNRNQIASAFRTNGPRASAVLGYIQRSTERVSCQTRIITTGKPPVKICEIKVTAVQIVRPESCCRKVPKIRKKPARGIRLNRVGNAGRETRELLKELWAKAQARINQ